MIFIQNTNEKLRYIALIPAYRPEKVLLTLLEELWGMSMETVVVDDGSGEVFSPLFTEAKRGGAVLVHRQNQGKGAAIKTALGYILSHYDGAYVIVTMDADGQHSPADALRLCERADRDRGALVLGSRKLDGGEVVPWRSRVGNAVTRGVFRLITGAALYDTQSGLRAFSGDLAKTLLTVPGERYEYETNVLLRLVEQKVPIVEMDISVIYRDNNAGSHFHVWRDSFRIYGQLLQFCASSLVSFGVDYGLFVLLASRFSPWGARGVTAANVMARIISGAVNYGLNRKYVFRSGKSHLVSTLQYVVLAAVILAANTWILRGLVTYGGMTPFGAKLVTEVVLFGFSWVIQRTWVFGEKRVGGQAKKD